MKRRQRTWASAAAGATLALGLFSGRALGEQGRVELGPTALHSPALDKHQVRDILTPVPIAIDVPATLPVRRVIAYYKVHGSTDWTALELRRTGTTFRGAIPCLEVSTITGDIRYYLRAHDATNAVIAYSGSRHRPHRVTIVREASDARAEARRCPDPADCPPGLPGCPSEEVERLPCKSDADCEGGLTCGWDGICEEDLRHERWLTLEFESGLGVVSTTGACSVRSQEEAGYLCRRERDGVIYTGAPVYTNEPPAVGTLPLRIVLGFEHLISEQNSVGVRLGYAVLGRGPTPPGGSAFIPYSAELRGTHVFKADPFASTGWAPYAFVDGGYAMYDIEVSARVREDIRLATQGGNDLEQELHVWRRAGDAFVGAGGGVLLMPTRGLALSAELSSAAAFPFGALLLRGSVGIRAGL